MRGHPRANGSASRWKKLSTYTQARSPPPRTLPPLPPPDLDEEGRVDNQRNTPHNTPLTVQLTVATSVTRNEILYSLNKPDDYRLAIVEFLDRDAHRVHYLRQPFHREPDFGANSVNYSFKDLLSRAQPPH